MASRAPVEIAGEEDVRQILRRTVNEESATLAKPDSRIASRFTGTGLDDAPLPERHGVHHNSL